MENAGRERNETMEIKLRLLSCSEIENWLACGDDYWESRKVEYHGEGLGILRAPLEKKMENMKKDPGNDKWYSYYCIIYQEKIVGLIGPKGRGDDDKSIEVGYGIGEGFRNRGLATAALTRFSEIFLEEEGLYHITARTAKGNTPSERVLTKCRFRIIGEENGELCWRLSVDH